MSESIEALTRLLAEREDEFEWRIEDKGQTIMVTFRSKAPMIGDHHVWGEMLIARQIILEHSHEEVIPCIRGRAQDVIDRVSLAEDTDADSINDGS